LPSFGDPQTGIPGRGGQNPAVPQVNQYGTDRPRDPIGFHDDGFAPIPVGSLLSGSGSPLNAASTLRFAKEGSLCKGKQSEQLIQRRLTTQGIIALPLGLPVNFTRTKLLSLLSKYSLEDFAASAFRQHRLGTRIQKLFIPIENLVSFTTTPLRKSLLKSVPKRLKKTTAELFAKLLEYSDPAAAPLHFQALGRILEILTQNQTDLVDEFVMQLIKQTINHRRSVQLGRTWQFFPILASIFPAGQLYFSILAH
jgi:hypothetical protein